MLNLSPYKQAFEQGITVGADVYLMMESDVSPWCIHWGATPCAAVEFMSQISPERLGEFCSSIRARLTQANTFAVATTSFIPEISNIDLGESADQFLESIWGQALCVLFRIADMLQADQSKTIIQIVVGNIIDQFKVDDREDIARFTVSARERAALTTLVLDRLSACLSLIQDEHGVDLNRVRIALELEPGPLYLLRNKDSLKSFAEAIDNHRCEHVKQCVGFNLDVAHWWLCRDLQFNNELSSDIRNKIFGSHISGHSSRGHFGDWGLYQLSARAKADDVARSQLEAYLGWLDLLSNDAQLPNASTYVSIELEAAKPEEDILRSIHTLDSWMKQINAQ